MRNCCLWERFCCCELGIGILVLAIIQSLLFGIALVAMMTLQLAHQFPRQFDPDILKDGVAVMSFTVIFFSVTVPRFATFWICNCRNYDGWVDLESRWCLAKVYVFTLVVWTMTSMLTTVAGFDKLPREKKVSAVLYVVVWLGVDIFCCVMIYAYANEG